MPATLTSPNATLYHTDSQLAAALAACAMRTQFVTAAAGATRKVLVSWLQAANAYEGHSRDAKDDLAQLVADLAWEQAEATPKPKAARTAEEIMADGRKGLRTTKPKADGTTRRARAPKVELGQLPEGAEHGTCQACGAEKPAKAFPKAVVNGVRQAHLRADECRACRDARRAGGRVAEPTSPEAWLVAWAEAELAEPTNVVHTKATELAEAIKAQAEADVAEVIELKVQLHR